jgi:hypothetical protein
MSNSSTAADSKTPIQQAFERYFEHAFAMLREDEYVTVGFSQERVARAFLREIEALVPGGVPSELREKFVTEIGLRVNLTGQLPPISEVQESFPQLKKAIEDYVACKQRAQSCFERYFIHAYAQYAIRTSEERPPSAKSE